MAGDVYYMVAAVAGSPCEQRNNLVEAVGHHFALDSAVQSLGTAVKTLVVRTVCVLALACTVRDKTVKPAMVAEEPIDV